MIKQSSLNNSSNNYAIPSDSSSPAVKKKSEDTSSPTSPSKINTSGFNYQHLKHEAEVNEIYNKFQTSTTPPQKKSKPNPDSLEYFQAQHNTTEFDYSAFKNQYDTLETTSTPKTHPTDNSSNEFKLLSLDCKRSDAQGVINTDSEQFNHLIPFRPALALFNKAFSQAGQPDTRLNFLQTTLVNILIKQCEMIDKNTDENGNAINPKLLHLKSLSDRAYVKNALRVLQQIKDELAKPKPNLNKLTFTDEEKDGILQVLSYWCSNGVICTEYLSHDPGEGFDFIAHPFMAPSQYQAVTELMFNSKLDQESILYNLIILSHYQAPPRDSKPWGKIYPDAAGHQKNYSLKWYSLPLTRDYISSLQPEHMYPSVYPLSKLITNPRIQPEECKQMFLDLVNHMNQINTNSYLNFHYLSTVTPTLDHLSGMVTRDLKNIHEDVIMGKVSADLRSKLIAAGVKAFNPKTDTSNTQTTPPLANPLNLTHTLKIGQEKEIALAKPNATKPQNPAKSNTNNNDCYFYRTSLEEFLNLHELSWMKKEFQNHFIVDYAKLETFMASQPINDPYVGLSQLKPYFKGIPSKRPITEQDYNKLCTLAQHVDGLIDPSQLKFVRDVLLDSQHRKQFSSSTIHPMLKLLGSVPALRYENKQNDATKNHKGGKN